jgi:hypothetical protein
MKQLILIIGLASFAGIADAQYNGYGSWHERQQPHHYGTTTITQPGEYPTYISGDEQSGTIVTPGEYPRYYNFDRNGNGTITTPGETPIYIHRD